MGLIAWIVVGGLAGWFASMIMKTDSAMGPLANIAVGIVGAIVGGFIVSLFGVQDALSGINITSIIVAILGSVVLLAVVKMFTGPRAAAAR